MNDDDKNNPGPQPWIDPALEARVVAAVMGEASVFEAEELERILAENPELAIFKRRIEAVHALAMAAARPQQPKVQLSPDRRKKLLDTIGVKAQEPGKKVRVMSLSRPTWWSSQMLLRVAACLVMGAIVVAFIFSVTRFGTSNGRLGVGGAQVASSGDLQSNLSAGFLQARFEQRADQPLGEFSKSDDLKAFSGDSGFVVADTAAPAAQPPSFTIFHKAGDGVVLANRRVDGLVDEAKAMPALAAAPASSAVDDISDKQLAKNQEQLAYLASPDMAQQAPAQSNFGGNQAHSISALLDSAASTATESAPLQKMESPTDEALGERLSAQNQSLRLARETTEARDGTKGTAGLDSFYMYRGVNTLAAKQAEEEKSDGDSADKEVEDSIKTAQANAALSANQSGAKLDGFVNYGSPINTVIAPGSLVSQGVVTQTQPVFATAATPSGFTGGNARSSGDVAKDSKAQFETGGAAAGSETAAPAQTGETAKLLGEAQGYYESGRYDLAGKRYEQALAVDQNDVVARHGLEQVNAERAKYYSSAYNETRSRALFQVDASWDRPVRRFEAGATSILEKPQPNPNAALINRKLDEIVIPRVEFHDATVREALDFLKQRAAKVDTTEQDTTRKGVNIVMKVAPEAPESEARITLSLTNTPLREALRYVTELAHLKLKVEPYAVSVVPQGEATEPPVKPSPTPRSNTLPAEIPTAKQPVSTFSLHVSDVSFQLAKDALAQGRMPDPERIRPEEFYNAFDYNDPSPAPGEEVACRIEQCAHPLLQQRDIVRIALKVAAAGRAAGQPLRLTILLDTSGSMEREDRAASVRQALQTLATLLGPNDRVTLIGFARTPRLLAEQLPGDQAAKLVEIAARTPSDGGTNLEAALALASEMALKQRLPTAQNRIVLLTDGAANLGDANPARLARQIQKTRQQGISFDACGVGANGLNDEILEALTRKGDGRYYFLNKPEDADASFARQLAGAFRPAAENVKVQVVFNPARVSQYRLIGFEKHLLKKEDFRNDKVQAAELSAEEAGVALYQVETRPDGEGELGEVFVRFRDPASGQMVERSWTMPYDPKTPTFDQASPSLQLAATAALLAERLQGNAQVDLKALSPTLTNLRSQYPHQARVGELIQMFERMRQ